jgi:hypothetical protein
VLASGKRLYCPNKRISLTTGKSTNRIYTYFQVGVVTRGWVTINQLRGTYAIAISSHAKAAMTNNGTPSNLISKLCPTKSWAKNSEVLRYMIEEWRS